MSVSATKKHNLYVNNGNNFRIFITVGCGFFICLITIFSLLNGSYYDDEIYNISIINAYKGYAGIIQYVNSGDVHPPGSYIINKILYDISGSWFFVKMIGGFFNAIGTSVIVYFLYNSVSKKRLIFITFILATTASFVMWGASNRWYAYFNPIFFISFSVVMYSNLPIRTRSIIVAILSVTMFYVSYLAFISIPIILIMHFLRNYNTMTKSDYIHLIISLLIAAIICVPQLYIFIHVHYLHNQTQVGSVYNTFFHVTTSVIFGTATFPVALLSIFYAIITIYSMANFIFRKKISLNDRIILIAIAFGFSAMVISGLGIKDRNNIYLLSLTSILIGGCIENLPRYTSYIHVIVLAAFQFVGCYNVIMHEDTLKISFNTHHNIAVLQIEKWKHNCSSILVFNNNNVLTYLLQEKGIFQYSPYFNALKHAELRENTCVVLVKNHKQSPNINVQSMYEEIHLKLSPIIETVKFDRDTYYVLKGMLAKDTFPQFDTEMELYRVTKPTVISAWTSHITKRKHPRIPQMEE